MKAPFQTLQYSLPKGPTLPLPLGVGPSKIIGPCLDVERVFVCPHDFWHEHGQCVSLYPMQNRNDIAAKTRRAASVMSFTDN